MREKDEDEQTAHAEAVRAEAGGHASDSVAQPGSPSAASEEEGEKEPRRSRPRSARIRHVGHKRLVIRGYRFNGHGAVVRVKGEDVEALLAYERVQRSCCGPRSAAVIRPLVKA